ncbi:MAG: ATP-binding protein, partial [Eubacterium sp.]|nr:ATP-binding protein [Candidatus Colimonas fimequi]
PAISARVRAPLENPEYTTIVDVGGNDSGARIINQFHKYFEPEDTERYLVVNANRFETDTIEGARFHLEQIQNEIKLPINGFINNTHMLSETTAEDVVRGHKLCKELSEETGIPIVWDTCNVKFIDQLAEIAEDYDEYKVFPLQLQLRPSWLDIQFR